MTETIIPLTLERGIRTGAEVELIEYRVRQDRNSPTARVLVITPELRDFAILSRRVERFLDYAKTINPHNPLDIGLAFNEAETYKTETRDFIRDHGLAFDFNDTPHIKRVREAYSYFCNNLGLEISIAVRRLKDRINSMEVAA